MKGPAHQMAVRLTLLAAPLLGVTLVLLALLPPSSHVASSTLAAHSSSPGATTPATSTPRPLPCSTGSKGDGDVRGKRETKGCNMPAPKGVNPEEELPRMSKRAVTGDLDSFAEEKRAPSSGFFGMRGKKAMEGEPESLKRAPSSGFFGMRGKKAESDEEQPEGDGGDEVLADEDIELAEKRAPSSGFFGMRGKKLPYTGYSPWYRDPKRARYGFFGTRGKKNIEGFGDDMEMDKKAPSMGFFGSRGKKSGDMEETPYEWSPLELDSVLGEKRAQMGFFGMRGKKGDQEDYLGEPLDYEKRAQMGFFGMRGKKSMGNDGEEAEEELDLFKRAPMGFFGMRGKKSSSDDDYDDAYLDSVNKRAPMGFFGMRGKKNDQEYWSEGLMEGEDKRAPMGFFGMRGKKDGGDDSSSSGVELLEEDKRAPMGFFGMRGKKSEELTPPDGWFFYPESKRAFSGAAAAAWPSAVRRTSFTLDSLLAYLSGRDMGGVGHSGWRPVRKRFRGNKKAPMGFFGMRGKKSTPDNLNREVWPSSSNSSGDKGHETEVEVSKQLDGEEEKVFQNQSSTQ